MQVLLTGASGFVGKWLTHAFVQQGITVDTLTRTPRTQLYWNPAAGILICPNQEYGALIHLAGESIRGRWTSAKKAAIMRSRLQGVATLNTAIATGALKTKLVIVASAVGYYGDTGNQSCDEHAPVGSGFAAQVCARLEQAVTDTIAQLVPSVCARFGLVLGTQGGALASMLPAVRFGLGGTIGSGTQYMSWITLEDLTHALLFTLNSPASGVINYVSPHPVTNAEFTHALCKTLGTKARLRLPAWFINLTFGQMGRELLLASSRIEPKQLINTGYRFRQPTIEAAFKSLLTAKAQEQD